MLGFSPDPLTVEVLNQGADQPGRIRLILPDGSGDSGQLDLDGLIARIGALQNGWKTAPQETGQALYQALFPGNLSNQFAVALAAARERGLRLMLNFDPALPALHRLPWERLYYPQGDQWLPLAASPRIYLSRHLQTGRPWGLPLPVGPLKVLVVISSPYPQENKQLYVNAQDEEQAIQDVFKNFTSEVAVDVLSGPLTVQQIADRLVQGAGFDVLHYIGHGEWRAAEQTGYLILSKRYDDGSLGPTGVSAAELIQSISPGAHLPQLIYLSACDSGQQSSNDAFSGVGPQLVQAGCPALVCMQEKVEREVARQFSMSFYAHLLESGCVDLAINRTRAGLLDHQYLEWATPALYMHLTDGILFNPQQRFQPAQRQPYKFLSSYQRFDADLFKGRDHKIAEVLQSVRSSTATVVYGDSGVGLTSLLEAGLRPALEADNALVVRIADYADLTSEFRKGLEVDGRPVFLRVPGDAPLSEVLRAVNPARFPTLVLALDQFELACALPEAEQRALNAALEDSLQVLGVRLKLIILIHADALPDLARFQSLLLRRSGPWIELPPLQKDEAVSAIVDPLDALGWPVTLNPALAREQIVPDLAELYPDGDTADLHRWVDPGQLQIACTWLYQKAHDRRPPLIDDTLYVREAGGADGILVRYMEEELQTRFAGQTELARQILMALAAPDIDRWASPQQVVERAVFPSRQTAAVEAILPLMDQMVKAELLVRKLLNGRYVYAFANQTIADEALRMGGDQAEQVYNAGDELERAWRLWLARQAQAGETGHADQALVTRQQLRLLAESGQHLDPKPVKLLLLLRSAVQRAEPPAPWLDRLRAEESDSGLLRRLEGMQTESQPEPASRSASEMAARLLGMKDPALPELSENDPGYGAISNAAVNCRQSLDRRTAVLALAALPPGLREVYGRLENALGDLKSGFARFKRRAELFGVLADAGQSPPAAHGRSLGERLGTYFWRGGRRVFLDRSRVAWMMFGGGIGAGLAMGLERLIVGSLAQSHIGAIFFALFSYWGLLLAGLTSLGMALARPLMLDAPRQRHWPLKLVLGGLFFGLANMLVAGLNGISLAKAPMVIPMGFIVGPGLSAAYLLIGRKGWGWLAGAVLAGLAFGLAELVFVSQPQAGSGISVSLSAGYFRVEFEYFAWPAWQNWLSSFPRWPDVLALIEAGWVGLALALGGGLGQALASRWQARWQKLAEQSGD
ncbi:protein containg CHAT domain [Longilinea arvoryzae]|uniref:Protein containg CHAT domain n=1 Tax=Longilinea arvoryzae TaxID=360412 RepID=A0A0S7BGT2_9CHLR|nr:CHAT domain-containing protein [Longilinea arvoryzae]GAP13718.1 protein containg CHAT domain [Longilinea arvoryzae]